RFPPSFYDALVEEYRERRSLILTGLRECGFDPNPPAGAYYVMAGIEHLTELNDGDFAQHFIEPAAGASVPGANFYANRELGRKQLRFSFPKRRETIERGLVALRAGLAHRLP